MFDNSILYSKYLEFPVSDRYDTAQETSNSQQYGNKLYLLHS